MARYFSKTELEALAKQLATLGTKDTEFEEAASLQQDDKIAIIQNGENKVIGVNALANGLQSNVRGIRIIQDSVEEELPIDDEGKVTLKLGDSLSFDGDEVNLTWTI